MEWIRNPAQQQKQKVVVVTVEAYLDEHGVQRYRKKEDKKDGEKKG